MDHFVVLPRRMKTGSLPAVGGLQAEDGPGSPGVAVAADELEGTLWGVCRPSCPRAFGPVVAVRKIWDRAPC
jgi:hypothetical protein